MAKENFDTPALKPHQEMPDLPTVKPGTMQHLKTFPAKPVHNESSSEERRGGEVCRSR